MPKGDCTGLDGGRVDQFLSMCIKCVYVYTYYHVPRIETMVTPKYEQYNEEQKAYLRAERLRVESKADKIKSSPSINKLHKTLTFSISQWALIEQVRDKMHLDDFNQTLNFCILEQARVLEIET